MRRGIWLAAGLTGALALGACSPHGSRGVASDHPLFAPPPQPAATAMAAPAPAAAMTEPQAMAATPAAAAPAMMEPATPMMAMAPAMAPEPAAPAPEPMREGWQGLMWGMSRADIRTVMPAATELKETVGRAERAGFGLDSYALPGCAARALMDFTPAGGLRAVRVVAKGNVDAACVRSLRQGLLETYGAPAHEEKPRGAMDIHNAVWRAPGTVVSLVSSIDGRGRGLFQIAYADPAAPAAAPPATPPAADVKARL